MMLQLVAIAAVVLIAGLALADWWLHQRFRRNAARIKGDASVPDDRTITEQDLRDLPEPIARYLRFSGVIGQKRISAVRVIHGGRFKPGADKPWMAIHGEYYLATRPPAFAWYGKIRLAPGVRVVALDSYANGRGRMLVKALSMFPIADDQSHAVTQSAFGRCVAELIMAPTFLLDSHVVRFTHTGTDHVRATITDDIFSTDADFFVNQDGSLDRIVVMRAFDRGGGRSTLERFTGRSSQPKRYDGFVLGSRMDGFWNLSTGDLHYASFEIERVALE
jgi:hypothetical protein